MVSDKGTKYWQNNTLEYGMQLLISDVAMIDPNFFLQENIPMVLDDYLENLQPGDTVSQLFKNVYYTYLNGMTVINSLVSQQSDDLQAKANSTSDSGNLFVNLLSFITIGIISFVGIFTFPLLGNIEERKISVLKFFNMLTVDQMQVLIKKGEDYRDEFIDL